MNPAMDPPPRAEALAPLPVLVLLGIALRGDIVSQIENAIIGFFQTIWNGITSFFGTIFGAIANAFAAIFNAPIAAIQGAWADLQNSVASFGIFAPLVTILVVVAIFVIVAYVIWVIIKLSVSEGEQTGEEVEEGV
jgi:hypothetical protein